MGRFYDGDAMAARREAVEASVLGWHSVDAKTMFGCPSYRVAGELFLVLMTDLLVLTGLPDDAAQAARALEGAGPFTGGPRPVEGWTQVPFEDVVDLPGLLPHVRASYEGARDGAG